MAVFLVALPCVRRPPSAGGTLECRSQTLHENELSTASRRVRAHRLYSTCASATEVGRIL
eukprot:scaffold2450_cov401-Prasinococcus_capsulatus_cf.AAC.8